MAKRSTNNPRLALYFEEKTEFDVSRNHDLDTINYAICIIDPDDNKPRNSSYDAKWVDNFRIHAQFDTGTTYNKPFSIYGWECDYRGYMILELRDLERMTKTLKRITAIEKKFPIHPATFGQYVVMVCKALGVREVVEREGRDTHWHTDNQHRYSPIDYAQGLIDAEVTRIKNKFRPDLKDEAVAS